MPSVDVEDLGSLLPQMLPRLWAFALRLCGNRQDAEDLLRRACVSGLERAHQLQPGTTPLSWMFSIVHSTWIDELRARKGHHESCIVGDDSVLQTVPDPSAHAPEQNALYTEMIQAVEHLPEPQRSVVLLVAVEGLSYAEAASVLGVPPETIMSRLSRARQTVGAQFADSAAVAQATGKPRGVP
jgi:RNA polymerase sigma-70 factor, ECF subfamily